MAADAPRPEPNVPAWPRAAQVALAFLLGVIATIIVGRFTPFSRGARPTEHNLAVGIDLNQAGKPELMQLPRVSDKRAGEILAARERKGGFATADDLRGVKGIGPARQAELQPWVRVDGEEQWIRRDDPAKPAMAGRSKKDASGGPIDVNRADADELQRLPGVGKVIAARLIAEREKAPFRTAEDLRRVAGIGPKTLDKLRPLVKFSD